VNLFVSDILIRNEFTSFEDRVGEVSLRLPVILIIYEHCVTWLCGVGVRVLLRVLTCR
jgi:predicted membrane protein